MKKVYLIIALFLCGCGSTYFNPYDGNSVKQGNGGIIDEKYKSIVIYSEGLPNKKDCKLLGVIDDVRNYEYFTLMFKLKSVENKAKEIGANTLVIDQSKAELKASSNSKTIKKAHNYSYTKFYAYDCR